MNCKFKNIRAYLEFINTELKNINQFKDQKIWMLFFYGYVNLKTILKLFVEQYDNALRNKVEKELQADAKSFNL